MTENDFLLALRNELHPIKVELKETRDDLRKLDAKVDLLDQRVTGLDDRVAGLEVNYSLLNDNLLALRLYIENEMDPKITLLAENYVPAAILYERTAAEIPAMKQDIENMKQVLAEHSEKLNQIA